MSDFECAPCIEPGELTFDVLTDPNERVAAWYPGAWLVSQGGNGGTITARPAENVFHIAASNWNIDQGDPSNGGKGIAGWNSGARACNGYVDQFGNMQQYASVWSSVNGTKDGNWRCRTWESWNPEGLTGSTFDSSTWTDEQCERFSDLLAWDNVENGALLDDMGDSRRGSHGSGVHRYGITGYNPWRAVGGEVWSGSSSKVCPGSARVHQLAGIVARARVIAAAVRAGRCHYLPPGRVNLSTALARTGDQPAEWDEMATKDEIRALMQEVVRAEVGDRLRVLDQVIRETYNRSDWVSSRLLDLDPVIRATDQRTANVDQTIRETYNRSDWVNERTKEILDRLRPAEPVTTYTVVVGDTLGKIAAKFGVTVDDLVAWNGLADPDNISVGQVLKVSAPKV